MTALDIILEGCETEEEYNNAIYMEAADIQLEKAIIARDTYLAMEKLNQRAAACKAATIADDFDKMVAFYEEENDSKNNSDQNKEGLLHKVWEGIKNLFNKIKETVFGSHIKEVPEEKKGKCPKVIKDLKTAIEKAVAAINTALSGKAGAVLNAMGAITTILDIRDRVDVIKNGNADNNTDTEKTDISGKEANILTRAAEKACVAVTNVLGKFEAIKPGSEEVDEKNPGDKQADTNILTKIQNKLRDLGKFLGSIPERVKGFFSKDGENSDNTDENKDNDNKDGKADQSGDGDNKGDQKGDQKDDQNKNGDQSGDGKTKDSSGDDKKEDEDKEDKILKKNHMEESWDDFDEDWNDYIDAILAD
jgi:hypothetical protein